MALTLVGVGGSPQGSTSVTPNSPTPIGEFEYQAGDVGYIYLASKRPGEGTQPVAPTGWTQVLSASVGSGSSLDGQGPIRVQIFRKAAEAANDFDTMPTITRTGTESTMAAITHVWRADSGVIEEAASAGSDSTSSSDGNFAFNTSSPPGFATDDVAVAVAINTHTTGDISGSSITASGATFSSLTLNGSSFSNEGDRVEFKAYRASVTAGSSSSNATFSGTWVAVAGAEQTGGGAILRIREAEPQFEEIELGSAIAEAGTVYALAGRMEGGLGTAAETSTLGALTGKLVGALGLVTEVSAVHRLGSPIFLGLIAETSTVNGLSGGMSGTLGTAAELGTPHSLTGRMEGRLGLATEAAALHALRGAAAGSIGLVTEASTLGALVLSVGGTLGLITEAGSVSALSGTAAGSIGLVTEAGSVNALSGAATGPIGLITESSTLNALSGAASGTLGLATEAGSLSALVGRLEGRLGLATEVGTVRALSGAASGPIGLVSEAGALFGIRGRQPLVVLGLVEETAEVLALTGRLEGSLVLITETGTVRALVREFPFALEQPELKISIYPRAIKLVLP